MTWQYVQLHALRGAMFVKSKSHRGARFLFITSSVSVTLAGGDANPRTFRSESRCSATALRRVATQHRHAGRCLTSTPLPVGAIRSSDVSVGEASASALAAFGLTLPSPTPASHAPGAPSPHRWGLQSRPASPR
jgi:hypothetical protein